MDSVLRRDGFATYREILHAWRMRPNTGSLPKDVVFVLALVFAQTTIFPTIFGSIGVLDLLTPWLVVSAVRQRPLQATVIALIGAFALETKLAVPAGIYLCSYWIMINVLFQIRPALSWRYRTPWLASYAAAALWVALFEIFVLLGHETWTFSTAFFFQLIFKLLVAVGFGMFLAREWMRIDAEEPVPL